MSTANICNRIFSGIQPTGIPHIGNYFGAIAQWIKFANERKVIVNNKQLDCDLPPIYSIVDVHAYDSQYGFNKLNDNILITTASLLAAGLDSNKCILFKQSDILEHTYLGQAFNIFVTTPQLTRLAQYRDKLKESNKISNALLNYPVLQAADILLYKANLVPVGEDQIQHIEITRDIARKFNSLTKSEFFPLPEPILGDSLHSRRIKSFRNPEKKMSKSDPNKKAFIEIIDEPEVIVEKCKKALTDHISRVYLDFDNRPGVSNLMIVYHLVTGNSLEQIREQFKGKESAEFKLELADVLIDKLKPVREEFKRLITDKSYLTKVLSRGAENAEPLARATVSEFKSLA